MFRTDCNQSESTIPSVGIHLVISARLHTLHHHIPLHAQNDLTCFYFQFISCSYTFPFTYLHY